jgi:hypothetical protein
MQGSSSSSSKRCTGHDRLLRSDVNFDGLKNTWIQYLPTFALLGEHRAAANEIATGSGGAAAHLSYKPARVRYSKQSITSLILMSSINASDGAKSCLIWWDMSTVASPLTPQLPRIVEECVQRQQLHHRHIVCCLSHDAYKFDWAVAAGCRVLGPSSLPVSAAVS